MAHPMCVEYASSHHPSRMERLSVPFMAAFMPLVPLASSGRRGVFSHRSLPEVR